MEGYRISPQQRHLWRQGAGVDAGYRTQMAISIEGPLDKDELKAAIGDAVERHEILRTTFQRLPGLSMPVQVIADSASSVLEEHDLTQVTGRDGEAALGDLFTEMKGTSVDLEKGPILYATLLEFSPNEHQLLLSLPALCSDSQGLNNLMRDICRCYEARQRDTALSDDVLQFADIAQWQNELLESEEGEAGKAFWRSQSIEDRVDGDLPFAHVSPDPSELPGFNPREVERGLGSSTVQRIKALADERGVPVSRFLEACWHVLLGRLAGRADVAVGTYCDGRKYEELAEVQGPFGKYLPLCCDIRAESRFGDVLQQVVEEIERVEQWQEVFEWDLVGPQVAEDGGPEFFHYCFECEEIPDTLTVGDVSFSIARKFVCTDRFRLKLGCFVQDNAILTAFQYDASLFEEEDIERLVGQYEALVASVLDAPEAPIGTLEIMSEAERQLLLVEFNDTEAEYPRDECIHHLIGRQAERNPGRTAISFGTEELTYGELNTRANQLARHLMKMGVGPEVKVGICVERSVEMIVGILGILKAGGCYVPLDPSYPRRRLAYMLADAEVPVLLTQERLVHSLPESPAQVFRLDAGWDVVRRQSREDPDSGVRPDNLAYVIYTSGSTGDPKGVLVTHRNLVNSTSARLAYFSQPVDSFLLLASFAFDSSVAGIFWTLCQGGTLVVPEQGLEKDPSRIVERIENKQVSHLTILPALYGLILAEAGPHQLASLRVAYLGGEACSGQLTEDHYSKLPDVPLFHAYGPTENTVWSSVYHLASPEQSERVPVGKPIANVQIYLLDEHMHAVPTGTPGEVNIGGANLARGYLGRPGLTAGSFVPNPFGDRPGERLYRTGDLARYLANGNMEFIGRGDDQVKVRGHRVELGEIEATLVRHPSVTECAVDAREDRPGERRLVAYFVSEGGKDELAADGELHELPNGLKVAHFDRGQTDALYRHIFENQTYVKHGISVADGDCVFDVGANIGLFTLFVSQFSRNLDVYAFEPIPETFDLLRRNVSLHGLEVEAFDCGLSDETRVAEFTFYPNLSGMSGAYADKAADEALSRAVLRGLDDSMGEVAEELLDGRFEGEELLRPVRTLSEVIHDEGIERIDLLKIDVEKSELDVLEGIDEADWTRIKQLVIEVHDVDGRLEKITTLLRDHGYEFCVDQDPALADTELHSVYAVDPSYARAVASGTREALTPEISVLRGATAPTGDELRDFLADRLPEYMVPSVLVSLPTLPRLPNGKVDRRALPAPEGAGSGGEGYVAPRTEVEESLASIWAETIGLERVGIHDNFFELGGDSILSIRVVTQAREVGLWLTPRHLFQHQTVAELAKVVKTSEVGRAQQGLVTGDVPLTPIQHWFFEQDLDRVNAFNLVASLDVKEAKDPSRWERAVREVIRHHDALRLRFTRRDTGWQQEMVPPEDVVPFEAIDLSGIEQEDAREAAFQEAADRLKQSLDLEAGPLLRVALFDFGDSREACLLIVVHHLAMDVVSWQILLDDLRSAYSQTGRQDDIELPRKTDSYKRWAEELAENAKKPSTESELPYWLSMNRAEEISVPVDHSHGANTVASTRHVRTSLGVEETRDLLNEVPRTYRTEINEVLLTALTLAFARWGDGNRLYLHLESHGREEIAADVDVTRTVGWFTVSYPLLLEVGETASPEEDALLSIKEQLRGVPRGGIGYGLLRYKSENPETVAKIRALPRPQVAFNYLGQLEDQRLDDASPFEFVVEPEAPRQHLLEFDMYLVNRRLGLDLAYSENVHDRSTVEGLASEFVETLRRIVAHCKDAESSVHTASDFEEFDWGEKELDDITAVITESQE